MKAACLRCGTFIKGRTFCEPCAALVAERVAKDQRGMSRLLTGLIFVLAPIVAFLVWVAFMMLR